MLRRRVIIGSFWLAKFIGMFALARWLTRRQLRILCYHGFALEDENRFRNSLFVSRRFFARRMRYLARHRFPVLRLDNAVKRLNNGSLPPAAVAITIDDGFHSTHTVAMDVLERHGFPSTLYLTSYYFEKGTPIFQLAIDYMFWKSPLQLADLTGLGIPGLEDAHAAVLDAEGRAGLSQRIHAFGAAKLEEEERVALSRRVAERLAVDYDRIERSRMLSLVTPDELRELESSGMRTGLHTHRHCLSGNVRQALVEIEENRTVVEPVIQRRMTDFCYPNGDWSSRHFGALQESGVTTATTCESGLASEGMETLALPRIVDDERVTMIEFEAEVTGFCEVLRRMNLMASTRAAGITFLCGMLGGPLEHALA